MCEKRMVQVKEKNRHHHGDLRKALIEAGLEILAQDGLQALTLRACAARAGVSHAAPAYHFKGLPGLLTALAAHGFQIFTGMMLEEREKAGDDPKARLLAICEGYLRFATTHRHLFDLMFNTRFDRTDDADCQSASEKCYLVLRETCAPFTPPGGNPRIVEMTVWSLVHGHACLKNAGQDGPPDANSEPLFSDILEGLALDGDASR